MSDPVEDFTSGSEETIEEVNSSDIVPQIVDDGLDSNTSRSDKTRNIPKLLTFKDFQSASHWREVATNVSDMELLAACQAEAKEPPINLSAVDPSPFMPPPMGIRSVLKKI
jgi:hypothetical protein